MMPLVTWLFALPWQASLLVLAAALFVVVETGFRIGRRRVKVAEKGKAEIAGLVAALITLLGVLLGFSFDMVQQRFLARQNIIIDEANAIGTTYLRAELLPDPQKGRIREDLKKYVELRLRPLTPEALESGIRESGEIHERLWNEVVPVAEASPDSEIVGRFLSALNQMIDMHTTRVTVALHQRLPTPIQSVLLTISILSMLLVGYWAGLEGWRAPLAVFAVVLSITFAMVMINEVDDPGAPLFEISQQAMEDLYETMAPEVRAADSNP